MITLFLTRLFKILIISELKYVLSSVDISFAKETIFKVLIGSFFIKNSSSLERDTSSHSSKGFDFAFTSVTLYLINALIVFPYIELEINVSPELI